MKRIAILLGIDSIGFFISLIATYFVFSAFKVTAISVLLIKAYGSIIISLWLLFLVTANFLGLYNKDKKAFSNLRILATSIIYLIELLSLTYIYPKYELARILFLIHFLFIYLFLNAFRLLIYKFSNQEHA